jgi:hypothetical protein
MQQLPVAPTATPRRGFLGRLLGGAAALAGGGLLGRDLVAQPAAPRQGTTWDMSWVQRVTGAHRQVFDAPEVADGTVLHQASTWMRDYATVYGTKDGDMSAVLVVRHAAIPIVLNDTLWERLELGRRIGEAAPDEQPVKDAASGEPARRNPFLNANTKGGEPHALVWPDGGLDTLLSRGAIVLACNLALRRPISMLVEAEKMPAAEARRTVLANLVPGVVVMPSGIFAVTRAQEAGCQYLRAT